MKLRLIILFVLMFSSAIVRSQNVTDSAVIFGIVINERHEPEWYAAVQIICLDSVLTGQLTDTTGSFRLSIPSRDLSKTHLLVNTLGYQSKIIPLSQKKKQEITAELKPNPGIYCPGTIIQYRIPLIDPWGPTKRSFTSEEIEKMAH